MTVKVEKTAGGYAVSWKQPYLNESFKSTFKSATFNPSTKCWEVGPRSGKRLEQWKVEAELAVEAATLQDELELDTLELYKLKSSLAALRKDTKTLEELRDAARAAHAALVSMQPALVEARAALEAVKMDAATAKQDAEKLLWCVIDLSAVREAFAVMASNHTPSDRRKKDKFEEARAIVKDAREQLKRAGLRCPAISVAASANINRPDRDSVTLISEKDWFTIRKIEPTEDD